MEETAVKQVLQCLPGLDLEVAQGILDGHEYPLLVETLEFVSGLPVVDMGAHVGAATVYFSEVVRPSTIHAYEPNETALKLLRTNIRDISNVEIFGEAVTSHNEKAFLVSLPTELCTGTVWDDPSFGGKPVDAVRADVALRRIAGPIGVLKIDTEGSEVRILETANEELSRVRVLFVEHHNEQLRKGVEAVLNDEFFLFYSRVRMVKEAGNRRSFPLGVNGYVHRDFVEQLCGKPN